MRHIRVLLVSLLLALAFVAPTASHAAPTPPSPEGWIAVECPDPPQGVVRLTTVNWAMLLDVIGPKDVIGPEDVMAGHAYGCNDVRTVSTEL